MNDTAATAKPYHHGDLRNALLTEAERILETEGMTALTLRAVARGAGVTHAAPANHFGDLAGLLSELAADGHRRMGAELASAVEAAGSDPSARARAMGGAYVHFARLHAGLFTLMFRNERLDTQRPSLHEAIANTRQVLRDLLGDRPGFASLPPEVAAARATAMWSLVHGYAVLMLEGRLRGMLALLPEPQDPEAFFRLVLEAVALTK